MSARSKRAVILFFGCQLRRATAVRLGDDCRSAMIKL
jgi:hypothetical protein